MKYSSGRHAPIASMFQVREGDISMRVDFEGPNGRHVTTGEVDPRERLIDVCDAYRAPVEFSCRSGTCGTCRVEVLEGADLLHPPVPDELETLAAFDAPTTHRLACRAKFRGLDGHLRLRWAGDDP